MAKVAAVSVGTPQSLAEVQAAIARALGGKFNGDAMRIPRVHAPQGVWWLSVERDSGEPGFHYAVLVFANGNQAAETGARWVRDRLAEHTPWRLATEFGDDEQPLDERPAQRTP